MVAKMQAMFDKADYEKGHALMTNNIATDINELAIKNGDMIRATLQEQISSGKVGSLTVDPQFLDFTALECKFWKYYNIMKLYN